MIGPLLQDPFFKNQRRAAISRHETQIGIDYVEFDAQTKRLKLHFIPAASQASKKVVRPTLIIANIRIQSESGVEQSSIRATGINASNDKNDVLEILELLSA